MHVRTFACNEIHILDDHHGGLQKTRQAEVFAEQHHLFCRHQQGRMVRQLRSQIVNRVCFARTRRTVKQESLPRLKLQRFQLFPRRHESSHIAVEHSQSLTRQNDIIAVDPGQSVDLDHAAAAHRIDMPLQRDDPAAIRSCLADQKFEFAEQIL